eukprot:992804-Rhodomonas_salina.3
MGALPACLGVLPFMEAVRMRAFSEAKGVRESKAERHTCRRATEGPSDPTCPPAPPTSAPPPKMAALRA